MKEKFIKNILSNNMEGNFMKKKMIDEIENDRVKSVNKKQEELQF